MIHALVSNYPDGSGHYVALYESMYLSGNIEDAVEQAAKDYFSTPEGRQIFQEINPDGDKWLSWGQFEQYVPDEFLREYGFSRVTPSRCGVEVVVGLDHDYAVEIEA